MEKKNERIITTEIENSDSGKRLDLWLSSRFTYHSRNQWQNVIKNGGILINGKRSKGSAKIKTGDKIDFIPDKDEPPVDLEYHRIYGDKSLFAINKSGNLPCHPAGPFFENTLWYALTRNMYTSDQIHFINRLDRETSGIILIGKTPEIASAFTQNDQILLKRYQVLVYGDFPEELTAEGYIFNDNTIPNDHPSKVRKKRIFSEGPPDSEFEVCKTLFRKKQLIKRKTDDSLPDTISLVEADLFTGRMHQIRATLCSLGYPLLGDKLYGPDESVFIRFIKDAMTEEDRNRLILNRQALHSARLVFNHPFTGKKIDLSVPMPEDMKEITGWN